MKLSVKAFAITAAIFWALTMLILNGINVMSPDYASDFLKVVASIYPGYEPGLGIKSIVVGTLYGLVDAAIGGAIFAWIYNFFVE